MTLSNIKCVTLEELNKLDDIELEVLLLYLKNWNVSRIQTRLGMKNFHVKCYLQTMWMKLDIYPKTRVHLKRVFTKSIKYGELNFLSEIILIDKSNNFHRKKDLFKDICFK